MNATFTVTFKGFPEKFAAALEKMLRDDIAGYPARMSMVSATVEAHRTIKTSAREGTVPREKVKAAVKKVKANG